MIFFFKKKLELVSLIQELESVEEPETRGEVTGNRGRRRGSESIGVVAGDGCK